MVPPEAHFLCYSSNANATPRLRGWKGVTEYESGDLGLPDFFLCRLVTDAINFLLRHRGGGPQGAEGESASPDLSKVGISNASIGAYPLPLRMCATG